MAYINAIYGLGVYGISRYSTMQDYIEGTASIDYTRGKKKFIIQADFMKKPVVSVKRC